VGRQTQKIVIVISANSFSRTVTSIAQSDATTYIKIDRLHPWLLL